MTKRRQLRTPVALAGHPTAGPRPSGLRVERPRAEALASGGVARMYLYDAIDSWGAPFGVSAAEFCGQLLALTCAELHLHLNSPGGDYFEAVAMYNGLLNHPAAVTVHVDGLAASAASVLAMAGDRLVMGAGAQLMIHNSRTVAVGTAADLAAGAAVLDTIDGDIAGFYAERAAATGSGSPDVASWRAAMAAESWYTAAEAMAAGLADDVVRRPGAAEGDDEPEGDEPEGDDEPAEGDDEPDGDEPDGPPAPKPNAHRETAAAAAAARWVAQWRYPGREAAPAPAAQRARAPRSGAAAAAARTPTPPPPAATPAPPARVSPLNTSSIRDALRRATA